MNIDTFRKMYQTELQEACSMERQLVDALSKMAQKAAHADLKQAIESHLAETRSHLERVEGLLEGQSASGEHKDQTMQAMVGEAEKWSGMLGDENLRDAGLVASAQRVEHYEIAVYGTLSAWAKQLGQEKDAETLHDILDEERAADTKLTGIAKSLLNPEAAH